ncbi:hypothetical protein [Burkholderia territorii]|uniref:hypothetical protein n=1 Tax=Burkholderia territorii TaxID=1503055 RepID=UPI000A648CA1|nr:hypothetical protein [Burkholderia territorii]
MPFPRASEIEEEKSSWIYSLKNYVSKFFYWGYPTQSNLMHERRKLPELYNEALQFVPERNLQYVYELLPNLINEPTSIDDLQNNAEILNAIYGNFDYGLGRSGVEGEHYMNNLRTWKGDVQLSLYELRDSFLTENPREILRFSLSGQHKKQYPTENIPQALKDFDNEFGIILFNENLSNNCSHFANALFNKLRHEEAKKIIHEVGGVGDDFSRERLANILNGHRANAVKMAQLNYRPDPAFPYGHHAKSTVAVGDDDTHYTMEAHTGHPFMLGPMLVKYESESEFLENSDENIVERWKKTITHGVDDGGAENPTEIFRTLKSAAENIPAINPFQTLGQTQLALLQQLQQSPVSERSPEVMQRESVVPPPSSVPGLASPPVMRQQQAVPEQQLVVPQQQAVPEQQLVGPQQQAAPEQQLVGPQQQAAPEQQLVVPQQQAAPEQQLVVPQQQAVPEQRVAVQQEAPSLRIPGSSQFTSGRQ